ncbi:MAG TPA: 2-phospho-L-lactate guanylyltransferase [Candidatus Binatia bacterium]|nr:2-phospho-L-lactate guanylyltransferase [Candidatus Binatia bacterium]
MKITALIPVKGFLNAKQRLSTLLGATEREFLAETMFRDVLRQVVMARGLSATFVVTGSGRVAEIASALGAGVIREPTESGETEAVDLARAQLRRAGCEAVLILPGDMPLVRSADIEQIAAQVPAGATGPFALLVPSHDRMGTNALLLAPPDVIKLRFGHDSFSFHMSQIAATGLPPRVLENDRIALDIDEPADLRRFLCFGDPANESHAVAHAILEQHAGEQVRRFGGL